MTDLLLEHGLILLFVLVAMESAGVPLPGETALVAAAILAQRGHYSLAAVIAVAAVAAIAGDNVGYWIGRKGGEAAAEAITRYGLGGAAAVVVAGAIVFIGLKVWRNRAFEGV